VLIGKIIDSDLRFNTFLKEKKLTFGQWKTITASRIIDLQRAIGIMFETKDISTVQSRIKYMNKISGKLKTLTLLDSLLRRVSDNDTLEVIQRQMKAKALKFIKDEGLDHGNGD